MKLGQRFLPPENPRTTCPPGHLEEGGGCLVIVASLQRSGTHLLIDAILNNFHQYKRRPLYVNLDRMLDAPDEIDRLLACQGYVAKTHFPQVNRSPIHEQLVRKAASRAVILSPVRKLDDVYRSSLAFGTVHNAREFDRGVDAFHDFWDQFQPQQVPFERLVDHSSEYPGLIAEISETIGVAPNDHIQLPPEKRHRGRIYVAKALTRLLGFRTPIVNTTIGFAKTPQ